MRQEKDWYRLKWCIKQKRSKDFNGKMHRKSDFCEFKKQARQETAENFDQNRKNRKYPLNAARVLWFQSHFCCCCCVPVSPKKRKWIQTTRTRREKLQILHLCRNYVVFFISVYLFAIEQYQKRNKNSLNFNHFCLIHLYSFQVMYFLNARLNFVL